MFTAGGYNTGVLLTATRRRASGGVGVEHKRLER